MFTFFVLYIITLLWTGFIWFRRDQWQAFVNTVMNVRVQILMVLCLMIRVFWIMLLVIG